MKAIAKHHNEVGKCVDFITVDGGEGGTGAAPQEFMNRVGRPLRDAIIIVDDVLRGAGIREDIKIIASGKITHGFSMVRALALGADLCNSARGFLLSLGCIQALKCNTNHCPTGITTTNERLAQAVAVPHKSVRVANYQRETVHVACELTGAAGVDHPTNLRRDHLMVRLGDHRISTFGNLYPYPASGSLYQGTAPRYIQNYWDQAV